MTTIRLNLLPFRAERRERRKRLFLVMSGLCLVLGLAVVATGWLVLEGYLAAQRGRNELIAAENRKLDQQIARVASLREEIDALRARQQAVEDLQADRNLPVYLFEELTRQTPEGIFLRQIRQVDRKVSVSGWAVSNERVSEFLRNLQGGASGRIERPELGEIRLSGQGVPGVQRRLFEFSLSFTMRPTPERAKMQADAKPPAKKS